jgi:hypothetical protein
VADRTELDAVRTALLAERDTAERFIAWHRRQADAYTRLVAGADEALALLDHVRDLPEEQAAELGDQFDAVVGRMRQALAAVRAAVGGG